MWWQPEFVEIISWNDYGESHHIGPLRDNAMAAFDIGEAPFNYALQHDGWRDILPFAIDMYKNNVSTITKEGVVVWHRLSPAADCSPDNTTVNTASQLQIEFSPGAILQDAVFFTALLAEGNNEFNIKIGGIVAGTILYNEPESGAGLYMGYAEFNGLSGVVDLQISRGGQTVVTFSGSKEIASICANGYSNFNAFVESAWSENSVSVQVPSLSDTVCISGTGSGEFEMLCDYTCGHGYCPRGACVCSAFGKQPTLPEWTGVIGYPIGDDSFGGLCGFACGLGYCPKEHCSTVEVAITPPIVSPFTPSACTGGSGIGDWNDICTFTCAHGFCPIALCTCEETGVLDIFELTETANAVSLGGDDFGLCNFACNRGQCPIEVCLDDDNEDQYGWGPDYNATDDSYYDLSDPLNLIYCDATSKPTTLDDLLSATDSQSISSQCWSRWTLSILLETLGNLQNEYNTSVQGFDDKFGYYVQWVKDSVGPALTDFMDVGAGNGNAFFDCRWTAGGTGKATVPCTQISLLNGAAESWDLEYTLTDSDGFYAAVASQLGIEKDWIAFGDWEGPTDCVIVQGPVQNIPRAIGPGGSGGGSSCVKVTHRKTNVPIAASDIVVTNPKTVIEAAMPNITALTTVAMALYFELAIGVNEANASDTITALSTPVFMLQNAVDSMNNIKKIGAEVEEEDKKNLILEILGIVLMVVPIIGEGGGALFDGIANVARIAALIGDIGNVALSAYDIVEDPSSAPFAIMGLLLGGVGKSYKSDEEVLGEAAAARRGLSDADLAQFGDAFVKSDSDVQSILKACIKGE
ncbi:glycoside hydrolase family 71 protein [Botrytis cinerea T4]|uniref:Glycoside hydrolase family 71 protein n=1 Tax=Botryotinia fuckeliana (strain T4) TaxID=999810 RepID=G2YXX3_BOTF4|nr:glycoside hydrolase family 71 protein [Botrytis cinerea T4]